MIPTLRVLMHMGTLQRLLPFWLIGMGALIIWFSPVLILAVIYGAIMQFVVEYVMHRFLYHRAPPTEQSVFNTLYRSHIGHHEFPTKPEFFTGDDHWYAVRFGLISVGAHFLILWPFIGAAWALLLPVTAIFVGSISAFTFYEFCHTLAHLRVPKGWLGEKITRDHMAHHFQDHHATFHVSLGMGWIDTLFGTPHDRKAARARFDRKTMLSLGMDPDDLRLVTARKAYGVAKSPPPAS